MHSRVKKWASFIVRWGIAVVGITWVLNNTSFHDRLLMIDSTTHRPVEVRRSRRCSRFGSDISDR